MRKGGEIKSLALAMSVTLLATVVFFLILDAFLLDEDFAGSLYEKGLPAAISGFTLGAITYVHQVVAGRKKLSFTALPEGIVRFESYTLPWYVMLVYGTCIVLAASGLGTFLIWLAGNVTGFYLTRLIPVLNALFVCLAFFWTGSWIGARCKQRAFLTMGGIVLVYSLLSTSVALLFGSSPRLFALAVSLLLYLLIALLGLGRGLHIRLLRYLQYLLHFVPSDARQVVADLVYSEVKRLTPYHVDEEFEVQDDGVRTLP